MSEFEQQEYWLHTQQRFEAALRFLQVKLECGGDKQLIRDAIDESIGLADLLLEKLNESRTKTDEDTPF